MNLLALLNHLPRCRRRCSWSAPAS
jgi:hypothetical protein